MTTCMHGDAEAFIHNSGRWYDRMTVMPIAYSTSCCSFLHLGRAWGDIDDDEYGRHARA